MGPTDLFGIPQSHKRFQKVVRKFVDEVVFPDAMVSPERTFTNDPSLDIDTQAREEDGKRPSLSVIEKMAYVAL